MIAFTGHRPQKLGGFKPNPIQDWVKQELRFVIENAVKSGRLDFMSGMALGVDQWAAELILELGGNLHCAIPFPSQHLAWPFPSQQHYYAILEKASSIFEVNPDPYTPEKMNIRNRYMVDHADALVAVWDGTDGGTANCVEYAQRQNKSIYRINPLTRTTG